jgi:hypothetical protein
MLPQENRGCSRACPELVEGSRAFRDLGFHSRVNLGILFDGGTESLIFSSQRAWYLGLTNLLASPSFFTLVRSQLLYSGVRIAWMET